MADDPLTQEMKDTILLNLASTASQLAAQTEDPRIQAVASEAVSQLGPDIVPKLLIALSQCQSQVNEASIQSDRQQQSQKLRDGQLAFIAAQRETRLRQQQAITGLVDQFINNLGGAQHEPTNGRNGEGADRGAAVVQ